MDVILFISLFTPSPLFQERTQYGYNAIIVELSWEFIFLSNVFM